MDNWFELEIETPAGWGVVMPPSLRVHGGLVDPLDARRYATKEEVLRAAQKFGKPIEMCRVYQCNPGGRWRVTL